MAPSVATFSCPAGLHLTGVPTLRCDVAGNWELGPAHRCSTKWYNSFGNPIVDRTTPDGAQNIQFVDTTLAFTDVGKVIAYDIFTGRSGTQAIQIWRPIDATAGTYTLLCENVSTHAHTARNPHHNVISRGCFQQIARCCVTASSLPQVITAGTADVDFHFQLPVSDHCLVGPGDVLGWYHLGLGVTDFDNGEEGHDDVLWHYGDHPGIGGTVAFTDGGPRVYS